MPGEAGLRSDGHNDRQSSRRWEAGEHLHAADPDYIQAMQVATEITEASKEDPGKGPTEIIESEIRDLPQEVVAKLPQRAALKRRINRVRQANFPQNPKTLEELGELPPEFRRTIELLVQEDHHPLQLKKSFAV